MKFKLLIAASVLSVIVAIQARADDTKVTLTCPTITNAMCGGGNLSTGCSIGEVFLGPTGYGISIKFSDPGDPTGVWGVINSPIPRPGIFSPYTVADVEPAGVTLTDNAKIPTCIYNFKFWDSDAPNTSVSVYWSDPLRDCSATATTRTFSCTKSSGASKASSASKSSNAS